MVKSKENKIKDCLILNEEQIRENVKRQIEWLKSVDPTIAEENGYKEGTREIRYLRRTSDTTKGKATKTEWSFNFWELTEKTEQSLLEKMVKMNGLSCCTFFSLYSFDKRILNEKGKKSNQINKENSLYTMVLPMDFDKVTEEQYLEQKQRLKDLDIEVCDVFTGHGYQALILLNKKNYDKELFTNFTDLLISKGFPVDGSIVDCSRIFRLPYTFNCKQFLINNRYYNADNPQGIPTYVYGTTERRYDVNEVFSKIESLANCAKDNVVNEPMESMDEEIKAINGFFNNGKSEEEIKAEVQAAEEVTKEEKVLKNEPKKEDKKGKLFTPKRKNESIDLEIKSIQEMYKYLDYDNEPEFVQNLLKGTPDSGVGNHSLMFIIPYFKYTLGLSLKEQIETLKVWGNLCTPEWTVEEITSEVTRLNKYKGKEVQSAILKELVKVFGHYEPNDTKITSDTEIAVNNDFFYNFPDYTHGAVKFFIALRYMQHFYKEENLSNFIKEEIMEFWQWSESTFKRYLSDAKKCNLVSRKAREEERENGQKVRYEFYPNPFLSRKGTKGYTKIKVSTIEKLINAKFQGSQPTLYLYLVFLTNGREKETFTSQHKLGKAIGLKQTGISKLTDQLHKMRFLKKTTIENEDGSINTTYRLLNN